MKPADNTNESMPFEFPEENGGGEPLNTSDPADLLYQGKPNERQRSFILDNTSAGRPSGDDKQAAVPAQLKPGPFPIQVAESLPISLKDSQESFSSKQK